MKQIVALGLMTLVTAMIAVRSVSERRDRPATVDDLRILTEAAKLLKDESAWSLTDDRNCTDDEATGKRSLFCAVQKACILVLGEYDHRRVALHESHCWLLSATAWDCSKS